MQSSKIVLEFIMRPLKCLLLVLVSALCFSSVVSGGTPYSNGLIVTANKGKAVSVMVTGSHIPQTVVLKSVGTATESPLRVIGRSEIDHTGRFTTPGILSQEPSLQILSGRGGAGIF